MTRRRYIAEDLGHVAREEPRPLSYFPSAFVASVSFLCTPHSLRLLLLHRRGRRQLSANTDTTRASRTRGREAAVSRYTRGTNTMLVYKPKGVIENTSRPASHLSIWPGGIVDEAHSFSLCISSQRPRRRRHRHTFAQKGGRDGNGEARVAKRDIGGIFLLSRKELSLFFCRCLSLSLYARASTHTQKYATRCDLTSTRR